MLNQKESRLYLIVPILFLLVYFQVFFADYAFSDEIHQLWYNKDTSNFAMFHNQGRWLTGLLFQKFFSSISTIEQLKQFRIFSLAGWICTTLLWSHLLRTWITWFGWNLRLWWSGTLFMVCSISVGLYIGWASCMEIFIGIAAALLSGHILFQKLFFQQKEYHLPKLTLFLSLLLGVVSLFIYQTTFGAFLLPFFLYYIFRKAAKPNKILITGILVYLATYLVYYLLFKFSLQAYDMEASTRTAINLNIISKLSFFFAGPIPSGFSFNLLYRANSIPSQLFYILAIIVWIIIVFKTNRHNSVVGNLIFMFFVLFLLAIIYLPLMVATEDFASNRTLMVFNVAVFLMFVDGLMTRLSSEKKQKILIWFTTIWLLLTAIYAFNFQFVNPLKDEYKALKNYIATNYRPEIRKIYFIRSDIALFNHKYYTNVYKDEFGLPSTNKDWVPEPITRQLVYELTGNRARAAQLTITQFENIDTFRAANPTLDAHSLVINMKQLIK